MLYICAMEGSFEVMEYLLLFPEVDVVNALDGFSETPAFLQHSGVADISCKKCFLAYFILSQCSQPQGLT